MGDVVNANLEPGEYVVRRNAVNSIGKDNMELLNQADGAHGALNKLMVSASLVNLQPQDNSPVKIEANGFPIADSPVRQRVDATRNMQKGGEVDFKEHMMYDKNDKGYLAKTYEDHLRMKKMGYSHKGMQEGGVIKKDSECVGGECAVPSAVNQEGYYSMPWKGKNVMIDTMSRMEEDGVAQYLAEGEGGDYFMMNESDIPADSLKAWSGNGYQEGGPIPYSEGSDWGEMNKEWARQKFLSDLDPSTMGLMENIRSKDRIDPATAELFARLKGKSVEPSLNGISPQEIKSAGGYQEGGEVGKYEKALQKAEMMGEAGYALPESLSAPAEEMSNMRSAEDLYGMYMRMGPQMVKDKMSGMESRALDSLLQQKMNNMDRPAVPQYGMGGMIDEYNMGGYVKKYQDGGEVEEDINPKQLQAMAVLDSLRQEGGEKLESLPSDSYGGQQVPKNAMTIIPYLKSFGRMRTPLQEQERFMFQRYGLNPDALPPQLQGLRGLALRQRMGNEEI
jgi:hypothetical protein